MAHPLHQDPEPSEAERRRKRLTQQAVQGKCLTHFHFTLIQAAHTAFIESVQKLTVDVFWRAQKLLMQFNAARVCAVFGAQLCSVKAALANISV